MSFALLQIFFLFLIDNIDDKMDINLGHRILLLYMLACLICLMCYCLYTRLIAIYLSLRPPNNHGCAIFYFCIELASSEVSNMHTNGDVRRFKFKWGYWHVAAISEF